MDSKELELITNSIQEKLGKENSALIADDLGVLITKNTQAYNSSVNKDVEINKLKEDKEKLVIANGNLLQKVSMDTTYSRREDPEEEKPKASFNFRDAFDENGRFKK